MGSYRGRSNIVHYCILSFASGNSNLRADSSEVDLVKLVQLGIFIRDLTFHTWDLEQRLG